MTLRKLAGLGALLSPQIPGPHLAQVTTRDSGSTPRRHRAAGPLLIVAIPRQASPLCPTADKLTLTDYAATSSGRIQRDIRWNDASISLNRISIPIRGST